MSIRHVALPLFAAALTLAGIGPDPAAAQERTVPPEVLEAAQSPEGLIRALYDMASFEPGPEPDWNMFRDAFLEDAIIVFSRSRTQPMRPMGVDGFIQDWKDFFRDYALQDKGFTEAIAGLQVTEFGGMAHAFVIFVPRVGGEEPAREVRGLDSIELSHDGERWWIAAITTDFEGPGKTIPAGIGGGGR